ncbi:hypothetical protein H0H92_002681 [Tricholoma furcatifolium]|nr:hypothetical protein H0H92_002681 [Tricholoma furcatifolium]
MSIVALPAPVCSFPQDYSRKRTSSFSCPPPKAPRVMGASSLRRTESYISLDASTTYTTVPYSRTLQFYKDQRELRRRAGPGATARTAPLPLPRTTVSQLASQPTTPPKSSPSTRSPAPAKLKPLILAPSAVPPPVRPGPGPHAAPARPTSPLAPTPAPRPSRPAFPRSKAEPDLLRKALRTCMRGSPEGQNILRMGPHLAVSIMSATRDLERLVAAAAEEPIQNDVVMDDATALGQGQGHGHAGLSKSWVVVSEDWEMVDCTAVAATTTAPVAVAVAAPTVAVAA